MTLQKTRMDCSDFFTILRRFLTSTTCFAAVFKTPAYSNPTNYLGEFWPTAGIASIKPPPQYVNHFVCGGY